MGKLYLKANFISIGVKINTVEKAIIIASKYFIKLLLKIYHNMQYYVFY